MVFITHRSERWAYLLFLNRCFWSVNYQLILQWMHILTVPICLRSKVSVLRSKNLLERCRPSHTLGKAWLKEMELCGNAGIYVILFWNLSFLFDGIFLMFSVFQDQSPNRSFDGFSGLSGLTGPVEPVLLNHSHTAFNGEWTLKICVFVV